MTFVFSKILWFMIRPGNLLIVLATVFGWWSVYHNRSWPSWTTAIAVSLLLIAGVVPVGSWISKPLEDRFPRPQSPPDKVDGIIVLGGSQVSSITATRGVLATNQAAERNTEAMGLAHRFPDARLLFSGGSGKLLPGESNERMVNEVFADLAGLDPARIIYEDRSRNTYENALFSMEKARPRADETWILVTSARHMPRSIGIFRKLGWNVVAWPVDYRTTGQNEWPSEIAMSEALADFDESVREWIGLMTYRIMGRTSELLPGPEPAR